jgi:hypothetical protein
MSIPDNTTVLRPGIFFDTPSNELEFQAEAGNRIEGEVIVNEYYLSTATITGNPYSFTFGFVTDPYGNVIVQSRFLILTRSGDIVSCPTGATVISPSAWQFAFIAATTGQYNVEAFVECMDHADITNPPSIVGTIRVTVYD